MQLDVLRQLIALGDYQLKFVVQQTSDLVEIHDLRTKLGAPAEKVLLMPEGRDAITLAGRSLWLSDICKEHGYRFTPRLHVMLWGDRRGI